MTRSRWFGFAALFVLAGVVLGAILSPASSQQPGKAGYPGRYQMYAPNPSVVFVIDSSTGKTWRYNIRVTGADVDAWSDLGTPVKGAPP